uniref:Uncharacterized protein n=1 Tax=Chenopodium quinoa TaxID=63459 RepID=A0A803LCI5_CHEQI
MCESNLQERKWPETVDVVTTAAVTTATATGCTEGLSVAVETTAAVTHATAIKLACHPVLWICVICLLVKNDCAVN